MNSPPTLRAVVRASGNVRVYSGDQLILTLPADIAKVVAKAIRTGRPVMRLATKQSTTKPKAAKKIKAAKTAINAPPQPFHLSRRPALSPSKTNLFRGSVSA